jgi:hypothetical protein
MQGVHKLSKGGDDMENVNQQLPLVTPIDNKEPLGEPILVNYLLDVSGSMALIKQELIDSFNTDCLGTLYNANEKDKKVIRVEASVFAAEFLPLWYGYKALSELSESPTNITQTSGRNLGLGNRTALYASILKGYGRLVSAAKSFAQGSAKNRMIQGKLIVLTDGANNLAPYEADEVKKVINWREPEVKVEKTLVYFATSDGLDRATFKAMAIGCGFDHAFFFDEHGRDHTSQQRALRHLMNIFSDPDFAGKKASIHGDLLSWSK